MPPNATTPISPEGQRAAERVRTLFYLIAAANIVLVAIVLWYRNSGGEALERDALLQASDRAIAAYNSADRDAFIACFSSSAEPKADAAFFDSVIVGNYHRTFGKITSHTLDSSTTKTGGEQPVLVFAAASEKQPRCQLRAEFIRESGAPKLRNWRIEPLP